MLGKQNFNCLHRLQRRTQLFRRSWKDYTFIIIKAAKRNFGEKVTLKELEQEYDITCKKYDKEPLKYTQFWLRIRNLSQRELINSEVVKKEGRERTTFVSLLNVPAEQIYKEVLKRLEN